MLSPRPDVLDLNPQHMASSQKCWSKGSLHIRGRLIIPTTLIRRNDHVYLNAKRNFLRYWSRSLILEACGPSRFNIQGLG